ncbi:MULTISPECIES: LysR substrate-binding domain-containing protein [unclassified Rhodococcus (in: high G+C Gram-positive bacteria)]|uniref:LysR substrate-binding domain-containing protein n=1 Tax=unclassified Rhodococcus (in: high G+C Gram-positive bacteria) TaxID=192944 RepID=UPI00289C1BAA|nr:MULTISPECIES: LysR substrate-binding domain-containing protein [unclassified Rhodococcus (in: high G+C Gram-positive bacteria)]
MGLRETENAEIVQQAARGEADLGVFAAAHELDLDGVDVTPYRRDRLVAVVPLGHRLTEQSAVTFQELLPENLFAARAMVPAFRAAANRLGEQFDSKHSVRSGEVAISLVQAGMGVTVQPECLLDHERRSRVAVMELAEPWAVRRIHLATARGRALSPATRALVAQLLDRPLEEQAEPDERLSAPS